MCVFKLISYALYEHVMNVVELKKENEEKKQFTRTRNFCSYCRKSNDQLRRKKIGQ